MPKEPPPIYPHTPQQYPGVTITQPQAPAPKQGSSWWKWLLGIVGVVLAFFVGVAVIYWDDARTPQEWAAAGPVGPVTITTQVDARTQEPKTAHMASVPASVPEIYASAPVMLRQGQRLSARWFINGTHLPDFDAEVTADRDVVGIYASFFMNRAGEPFTPGSYRVVLSVDGAAAAQGEFTVK